MTEPNKKFDLSTWSADYRKDAEVTVLPQLDDGEELIDIVWVSIVPAWASIFFGFANSITEEGYLCRTDKRVMLVEIRGIFRKRVKRVDAAKYGEAIDIGTRIRRSGTLRIRWPSGRATALEVAIGSKDLDRFRPFLRADK